MSILSNFFFRLTRFFQVSSNSSLAIFVARLVSRFYPHLAKSQERLAQLYLKQGNLSEALAAYNRSIDLSPNGSVQKKSLRRKSHGRRILLLERPSQAGGSFVSLLHWLHILGATPYEPVVATFSPHQLRGQVKDLGVPIVSLFTSEDELQREIAAHRDSQDALLCGQPRLRALLEKEPFDLMHHNTGLEDNRMGLFACAQMGLRQVCNVRTTLQQPLPIDVPLSRHVFRYLYNSRYTRDFYLDCGFPRDKALVVYPGFDVRSWETFDNQKTRQFRQDLDILEDTRIVTTITRFKEWKGCEYFVRSIPHVLRKCKNVKAVIVGQAWNTLEQNYQTRIQRLVKSLGLDEIVVLAGYHDDVRPVVFASDVIVHTSIVPEPFGRVIVEGMLAGKPVVATDQGGPLEIIRHGEDGILVPMKAAEKMGAAIGQLLINEEHAKRIAHAARESARRFDRDLCAKEVLDLYDRVLAGREESAH